MSTHEAVCRAVSTLERRPALLRMLLAPLERLTVLQAAHDPAVRARNGLDSLALAQSVGGTHT